MLPFGLRSERVVVGGGGGGGAQKGNVTRLKSTDYTISLHRRGTYLDRERVLPSHGSSWELKTLTGPE